MKKALMKPKIFLVSLVFIGTCVALLMSISAVKEARAGGQKGKQAASSKKSFTQDSKAISHAAVKLDYREVESYEIMQPNSNLIWQKCPVGQSWSVILHPNGGTSGGECKGTIKKMTVEQAKEACPDGYRLPTVEEFRTLLGGCDLKPPRVDERLYKLKRYLAFCEECKNVSTCSSMFGSDSETYISSSTGVNRDGTPYEYATWGARFSMTGNGFGSLYSFGLPQIVAARCVR